LTGDSAGM